MKTILQIFLLVLTGNISMAQNLYLNEVDGTETEYEISDVRKLEFTSSEVLLIMHSGDTIFQPITELKNYRYNSDNSLSVETPSNYSYSLMVYPNPTKDDFEFKFIPKKSMLYTLSITDIKGRKLDDKKLGVISEVYRGTVSLASYPAGIYFLTLKGGNMKISKKILKY